MHAVDCNFVVINIFIVLPKKNTQSTIPCPTKDGFNSIFFGIFLSLFFLISLDPFGFQITGNQKILTITVSRVDITGLQPSSYSSHKHMENYYHIKPPKKGKRFGNFFTEELQNFQAEYLHHNI